ncbi:hypothetical protein LC593_25005 [Nostoc sp. CHAB 5844]|nr:hypothetical protein [Nostoc sp. CHAB 5844]
MTHKMITFLNLVLSAEYFLIYSALSNATCFNGGNPRNGLAPQRSGSSELSTFYT